MAIERQHGQQCITCDGCDEDLEFFDKDEFSIMVADAKGKGWKITPDGEGGWNHRCPSCQSDRVSEARRMFGL